MNSFFLTIIHPSCRCLSFYPTESLWIETSKIVQQNLGENYTSVICSPVMLPTRNISIEVIKIIEQSLCENYSSVMRLPSIATSNIRLEVSKIVEEHIHENYTSLIWSSITSPISNSSFKVSKTVQHTPRQNYSPVP